MKVLIVAGNISAQMGGEAVLPFHYIRELSARGFTVWAATHARVRGEIEASEIAGAATFRYVEDSLPEQTVHRVGMAAPASLRDAVFNAAVGAVTMQRLGSLARRLDSEVGFDVIHQPTPVSPLFPSFVYGTKAPVIIGPMNGAMAFPPAFRAEFSKGSEAATGVARTLASGLNMAAPGKRRAARLLVANERTRDGLPAGVDPDRVSFLVENGVDLSLWRGDRRPGDGPPLFVYVGRLVWWKAVELLIEAFGGMAREARLLIIGDGPERAKLEGLARATAGDRIEFAGFIPQAEIRDRLLGATALALPSLRECGGAVILEAFACGAPAIATDWGGPKDYITPETGVLAAPTDRRAFVDGFRRAMDDIAGDPARAARMGEAAKARVEAHFSWSAKTDRIIEIYREVAAERA